MDQNPYIFGDAEVDRQRLEAQSYWAAEWLRPAARRLIDHPVRSILDLGCGEGQLGRALREVYPQARLAGVDRDPQAIAVAQAKAAELGLADVQYSVADVQEGVPGGPYDLIYASLILLHTPRLAAVVAHLYAALAPGGTLWVKDLDPGLKTASANPAYRRLTGLIFATLAALGAHPDIRYELPPLLEQAGFTDQRLEMEYYPLGGETARGRGTLAATLGAFYNARLVISKTQGLSEGAIIQLYTDITNAAMHSPHELGTLPLFNLLARRPA